MDLYEIITSNFWVLLAVDLPLLLLDLGILVLVFRNKKIRFGIWPYILRLFGKAK